MNVPCCFIVPAGGKGLRFGGDLPKQFSPILGKPLIMYTLERIAPFASQIILPLPADYLDYWNRLCFDYNFTLPHQVVLGGATRFESVRNALEHVPRGILVAVHDAVRPLVAPSTIEHLLAVAQKEGAALPYTPMTDSIRRLLDGTSSESVDRVSLVRVQTPQVFRSDLLLEAYMATKETSFTDDASVYEQHFSTPPALIEGNVENIKITNPMDALWLEMLLKRDDASTSNLYM